MAVEGRGRRRASSVDAQGVGASRVEPDQDDVVHHTGPAPHHSMMIMVPLGYLLTWKSSTYVIGVSSGVLLQTCWMS